MSGNHTPTPWRFNKHGRHSEYFGNIVGGYGLNERGVEQIRTITCQLNYGTQEENQANADLIVAAVNSYASSQAEIERLKDLARRAREMTNVMEALTGNRSDDDWVWALQADLDAALLGSKEQ